MTPCAWRKLALGTQRALSKSASQFHLCRPFAAIFSTDFYVEAGSELLAPFSGTSIVPHPCKLARNLPSAFSISSNCNRDQSLSSGLGEVKICKDNLPSRLRVPEADCLTQSLEPHVRGFSGTAYLDNLSGKLQSGYDFISCARYVPCRTVFSRQHGSYSKEQFVCRSVSGAKAASSHEESAHSSFTLKKENILNLSDHQRLYAKLASNELASTLINLQLVSNDVLVSLGTQLLRSRLMDWPLLSRPVHLVLERTAYQHFCAGGTLEEAAQTLKRMWDLGLQGILDYSIEDALTPTACDRNLRAFISTIAMKDKLPAGSVSFACVKMTALCPLPILEKTSALLRWHHANPSEPLPWLVPSLPVLAPESPPPPQHQPAPEALTPDEEAEVRASLGRLQDVAKECRKQRLPLLVDAEYTSVQPAIDYITFAVAREFNREAGQLPLIYGTIQAYLKDSKPRLEAALSGATEAGVSLGIKLVRGAYLTRETEKALSLGVPSPIHGSIDDTHKCYNECAAVLIAGAARGGDTAPATVLATHNVDSGRAAVQRMLETGLSPQSPLVQFAQLKGMADGLSLGLRQEGFHVSKYLPFGPVEEVIPYLIRRAEENRGLLGNTLGDRRRLRKELWRRATSHWKWGQDGGDTKHT